MRDSFLFHFRKIALTLALWIFSSTQALPLAIQGENLLNSQSIEEFQRSVSDNSNFQKKLSNNIKLFQMQGFPWISEEFLKKFNESFEKNIPIRVTFSKSTIQRGEQEKTHNISFSETLSNEDEENISMHFPLHLLKDFEYASNHHLFMRRLQDNIKMALKDKVSLFQNASLLSVFSINFNGKRIKMNTDSNKKEIIHFFSLLLTLKDTKTPFDLSVNFVEPLSIKHIIDTSLATPFSPQILKSSNTKELSPVLSSQNEDKTINTEQKPIGESRPSTVISPSSVDSLLNTLFKRLVENFSLLINPSPRTTETQKELYRLLSHPESPYRTYYPPEDIKNNPVVIFYLTVLAELLLNDTSHSSPKKIPKIFLQLFNKDSIEQLKSKIYPQILKKNDLVQIRQLLKNSLNANQEKFRPFLAEIKEILITIDSQSQISKFFKKIFGNQKYKNRAQKYLSELSGISLERLEFIDNTTASLTNEKTFSQKVHFYLKNLENDPLWSTWGLQKQKPLKNMKVIFTNPSSEDSVRPFLWEESNNGVLIRLKKGSSFLEDETLHLWIVYELIQRAFREQFLQQTKKTTLTFDELRWLTLVSLIALRSHIVKHNDYGYDFWNTVFTPKLSQYFQDNNTLNGDQNTFDYQSWTTLLHTLGKKEYNELWDTISLKESSRTEIFKKIKTSKITQIEKDAFDPQKIDFLIKSA